MERADGRVDNLFTRILNSPVGPAMNQIGDWAEDRLWSRPGAMPDAGEVWAIPNQSLAGRFFQLFAFEEEKDAEIWQRHNPGRPVHRDLFGRPFVLHDGLAHYFNKPGFSAVDVGNLVAGMLAFGGPVAAGARMATAVHTGRAPAAISTLMRTPGPLRHFASGAGTSAGLDLMAHLGGAEEVVHGARAAAAGIAAGATGAFGYGVAPAVHSLLQQIRRERAVRALTGRSIASLHRDGMEFGPPSGSLAEFAVRRARLFRDGMTRALASTGARSLHTFVWPPKAPPVSHPLEDDGQ